MLMFTCQLHSAQWTILHVSIHPMLMFTETLISKIILIGLCFNTSYVNVYPGVTLFVWNRKNVSIHPMLMFISGCAPGSRWKVRVSIHPMLMFIYNEGIWSCKLSMFQYILC